MQPAGFGGRGGPPNVLNAKTGDQYRFNWNTPVVMSPHNSKIVWLGGNRLFKSYNQGDTWVASDDLTKQIDRNTVSLMGVPGNVTQLSKNDGVVSYGTIVSISESPILPGIVWAGTDDGNLQVSRDGGVTFTEVGKNLPGLPAGHRYWISRVDASHFDPATAYIAVDGHHGDRQRGGERRRDQHAPRPPCCCQGARSVVYGPEASPGVRESRVRVSNASACRPAAMP